MYSEIPLRHLQLKSHPTCDVMAKSTKFLSVSFYYNQQMQINIIQVYIKKVSLCNLLVSTFLCHHQAVQNQ